MHKKIIMACMAIAAFAAFVMPSAASASPELTSEGKTVPVGTSITAKNTGITKFTGPFNVECSTAHMTGTVSENTGTHITGDIPIGNAKFSGTGTGEDCTSALGSTKVTVNSKICLTTIPKTDNLTIDGCLVSGVTQPIVFTLEITGTGPCKYSVPTILGSYQTNVSPVPVTISEQEAKKSEGGFFCPASGKLDMVFDLYTTGLTPVDPPGTPLTVS